MSCENEPGSVTLQGLCNRNWGDQGPAGTIPVEWWWCFHFITALSQSFLPGLKTHEGDEFFHVRAWLFIK